MRYVTPEEPYIELDEQRLDIKSGRNQLELTPRNHNKELWFSGIFRRGKRSNNSYEWGDSTRTFVSVSVDWTQTGHAPEDKLCTHVHRRPYYQRVYAPQLNSKPSSAMPNWGLTSLFVLTLLR
nr:unnamed protein product [Spirometra erinaceieuropaei]